MCMRVFVQYLPDTQILSLQMLNVPDSIEECLRLCSLCECMCVCVCVCVCVRACMRACLL